MSNSAHFQLSGNAAKYYDQISAKYVLGPWAPRLVEAADIKPDERVLDLACGTGVVTRAAALMLGPGGSVTGLDLNAGMLEVAESHEHPGECALSWLKGSALDLDLPDQSFDVVLCQQGLQYFPDQLKGLRESHRVLRSGGRAFFGIWAEAGPYNKAVGAAVAEHIDDTVAKTYLESRDVPDVDSLRALFSDAGFAQVEVVREQMEIRLPDIRTFVLTHTRGTPIAKNMSALSESQQSALANDAAAALSSFADGVDVVVPDFCNLVSARA